MHSNPCFMRYFCLACLVHEWRREKMVAASNGERKSRLCVKLKRKEKDKRKGPPRVCVCLCSEWEQKRYTRAVYAKGKRISILVTFFDRITYANILPIHKHIHRPLLKQQQTKKILQPTQCNLKHRKKNRRKYYVACAKHINIIQVPSHAYTHQLYIAYSSLIEQLSDWLYY